MKSTVLLVFVAAALAQAPAGFEYFPAAKLNSYAASLKAKEPTIQAKSDIKMMMATETFGDHATFNFVIARRDENGEPELHADWNDIFIAKEGEGTLVIGGKLEGGRTTGPGEIRGGKIVGGRMQKLVPGDMAVIPAGMPHQTNVEKGKSVFYMVIKVKK